MTDRKTRANGVRNHTDDSPHTHGRQTEVLKHRWPTALGIAVAALAAFDVDDGLEFAALTVLMALVYLRRGPGSARGRVGGAPRRARVLYLLDLGD